MVSFLILFALIARAQDTSEENQNNFASFNESSDQYQPPEYFGSNYAGDMQETITEAAVEQQLNGTKPAGLVTICAYELRANSLDEEYVCKEL